MKLKKFFIVLSLGLSYSLGAQEKLNDVIPITMGNLRGQELIYNEGWYIISSTRKSLEYCREKTITTYKQAVQKFVEAQKIDVKNGWKSMHENTEQAKAVDVFLTNLGELGRKKWWEISQQTAQASWQYSLDNFAKSWETLLLGTVHVSTLTENDYEELMAIPSNAFSELKKDFKNLKAVVKKIKGEKSKEVELRWSESFDQASKEWLHEYHKSGEAQNSLTAIPYLLWGHIKAAYYGLFKPSVEQTGEVVTYSAKKIGKGIEKLILLPAAAGILVSGRTIYSLGGVVYYSGKMGIKIISEVSQSALLASMALLSAASVAPNYLTLGTLGVANQVALSATGKIGGVASWTLANTATTAKYAGNLVYDLGKNVGEAVLGTSLSAIVLGYNALTALPVQLGLGAVNSVFFLVWEGPKLAIYSMQDRDNASELPVGAVVDLEKLQKKGIIIEKVSEDPKILQNVLEALPQDLNSNQK